MLVEGVNVTGGGGRVGTMGTGGVVPMDRNSILRPLHNNNIDQARQTSPYHLVRSRRHNLDIADNDNVYDTLDVVGGDLGDGDCSVSVRGAGFNWTGAGAGVRGGGVSNITYLLPLSRFMPDQHLTVTFTMNAVEATLGEVELCGTEAGGSTCDGGWRDGEGAKPQVEVNGARTFRVDVRSNQHTRVTFRASLLHTQNVCSLSASEIGKEFVEYNLNFFRDCSQ